jgi:hypothetical protein
MNNALFKYMDACTLHKSIQASKFDKSVICKHCRIHIVLYKIIIIQIILLMQTLKHTEGHRTALFSSVCFVNFLLVLYVE